MRVIYADILFIINLALDYLLLFGTARLAGAQFRRISGLFGALIGAIYSFSIFFDFSIIFFAATKLTASLLMIITVFGKRKIKEIIRLTVIFYICGFLFSGFMMLMNSVVHADSFFIKGGVIYFEFTAVETVISGVAAFLVTEILRRLFHHGEAKENSMVRIFYKGKSTVLKGFLDTGNMLEEPFRGTPVAVAEKKSLYKILPQNLIYDMENAKLSTENKIKLIPCKTVSGTVLIPAIKPDRIVIKNENGEFEAEDLLVASSDYVPEGTIIFGENLILREKTDLFRRYNE